MEGEKLPPHGLFWATWRQWIMPLRSDMHTALRLFNEGAYVKPVKCRSELADDMLTGHKAGEVVIKEKITRE